MFSFLHFLRGRTTQAEIITQEMWAVKPYLRKKAALHNTYIGQVERGEKNLTLISLEKILSALGVTFSELFEYMGSIGPDDIDYAAKCYSLISKKTHAEQHHLFLILQEIESLSKKK